MRVPYGPIRTDAVVQIPSRIRSVRDAAEVLAAFLSRAQVQSSGSEVQLGGTGEDRVTGTRCTGAETSRRGRGTALLTGAGISVPSGIPDYRGTNGTYTVNKTYRPIFYNEFRDRHTARQRYWARSFLGYPPVSVARPNIVHTTVGDMMRAGIFDALVTQNVDGLHTYQDPQAESATLRAGTDEVAARTTELHGSLHKVVCLSCRDTIHRRDVQDKMRDLNPAWLDLELPLRDGSKKEIKTNPDGDVDLPKSSGVTYETFRYPACRTCLNRGDAEVDQDGAWTAGQGILKPSVVFFGESVPVASKDASDAALSGANGLLCMGTSLAVYSAFRFIKAARAQGKPIAVLNEGHVRDEEKWINEDLGDIRINMSAETVLPLTWDIMQNTSVKA